MTISPNGSEMAFAVFTCSDELAEHQIITFTATGAPTGDGFTLLWDVADQDHAIVV